MGSGLKDRVAILGMGCTRFGERWDADADMLMFEAFEEAIGDANIDVSEIGAAWLGVGLDAYSVGPSGIPLSIALRLPNIAVTKVENYCCSGTESFRGAVYAVASGAYDIALAMGVEKVKDTGYGGLPTRTRGIVYDMMNVTGSAPGYMAQLATAYQAQHQLSYKDLKQALAHISVKSHANAAKNPKAHLRNIITEEQVLNAPMVAYPLGLFDCCGTSDGAACAIVTTPEIARRIGKKDLVTVKALELAASNGWELQGSGWDGSYFHTTRIAVSKAYGEAGIRNPRKQLSLMEVHDCFSITELVTMEDLGISEHGQAVRDVLDGVFDADGELPCGIDGGLKCFGHPIGASGLRMIYENYLQLLGRAGPRQIQTPTLALSHNAGGLPNQNVSAIAIVGLEGA